MARLTSASLDVIVIVLVMVVVVGGDVVVVVAVDGGEVVDRVPTDHFDPPHDLHLVHYCDCY